ncbi:MAG: ATP-binding protein [Bacteroidota bacterium]
MPRLCPVLLLLLIGAEASTVLGQKAAPGPPLFSQRYDAGDLGLEPQNWTVVQDSRGQIVVGNNGGLALFDGQRWETQSIPNFIARAIAADADGQLFVGGIDEMGQLVPDSLGQLRYESLRYHLPDEDYGDIWNTLVAGEQVIFQGRHHLLIWDGERFEVVQPEAPISRTYVLDDTLFVHLRGQPLRRWQGGQLEVVAGTGALADHQLFALHRERSGSMLMGTRSGQFYRLSGSTLEALSFEGRALFEAHRPYAFAVLPTPDGEVYAVGTFGGGIVLLNEQGTLIDHVPLSEDEWVLDLTFDHQGGLWAALYNGLLRVDVLPSIRRYDAEQGLLGLATQVVRRGEQLYATTALGVYRASVADPRWEPVLTEHGQAWALSDIGGRMLAATNAGLFDITGEQAVRVSDEVTFTLHEVEGRPGYVYAGLRDGLVLLQVTETGAWRVVGRVAQLDGDVFAIGQRGETLWVTLAGGEVLLLDLEAGLLTPDIQTLADDDRPDGRLVYTEIGGAFAAAGEEGVYRAAPNAEGGVRLVADSLLNSTLDLDGKTYLLLSEIGDELWVVRGRELLLFERTPRGYRRLRRSDLPLDDLHISHIASDGQHVWLATEDGLLRYDPKAPKRYDAPYRPLFRQVARGKTLLFGGTHGQDRIAASQGSDERPVLAYSREELRFHVAAPSYNAPERVVYQYRLEGFDAEWSAWTTETTRSYTNLPERKQYVFRVRARNIHGVVSDEAQYRLRVLPPWYRSWGAYTLYVIMGIGLVWGVTTVRTRAHQRELEQERLRRQRLDHMNQRLEQTNRQLAEADELKTHLLQNASHELRTPLTAMLGTAELLSHHLDERDPDGAAFARTLFAGTERLTRTVTDLMDVANLQAGQYKLTPTDVDVSDLLTDITDGLAPMAQEDDLYLRVSPEHIVMPAVLDPHAFRRVVEHVLDNAFKFTDEGGVSLVLDGDADGIVLRVTDTGSGIEPSHLDRLTKAFTQASSGRGRTHEGSGMGLYIVTALMKRMLGTVRIESEPGTGTTVMLTWPRFDRRGITLEGEERAQVPAVPIDECALLFVGGRAEQTPHLHAQLKRFGLVRAVRSMRAARRAVRLYPYDAAVLLARDLAEARKIRTALAAAVETLPPLVVVLHGPMAHASCAAEFAAVLDAEATAYELHEALRQALQTTSSMRVAPRVASGVGV